MTDKEKIRKEVERLKLCTMDEHMKFYSGAAEAEYNALCNIEYFIDSLQEESISEDLEEAATKYAQDKYLPVQTAQSFKAGAQWQKEQMMKDAVYGLVCGHDESSPAWIDLNLLNKPNVKVGTEVKLIIIKDK